MAHKKNKKTLRSQKIMKYVKRVGKSYNNKLLDPGALRRT